MRSSPEDIIPAPSKLVKMAGLRAVPATTNFFGLIDETVLLAVFTRGIRVWKSVWLRGPACDPPRLNIDGNVARHLAAKKGSKVKNFVFSRDVDETP